MEMFITEAMFSSESLVPTHHTVRMLRESRRQQCQLHIGPILQSDSKLLSGYTNPKNKIKVLM
jgi:hypothetical protein